MTNSDIPGNLTGSNPLVSWLNRIKLALCRRTILPGVGYKVRNSESGVILEILPAAGQASPSNPFAISVVDDEALTFQVTPGKITTTGIPIPPSNIDDTFTLEAGSPYYWFYLDVSADAATIETSDDPGDWSVNKIPLGYVDTSVEPVEIVQLVRDHIFIPCA